MKMPKTETEYTKFMGGLDLETPPISIKPGALIAGMNYVAGSEGGYERIDGYERFDGQASPSDATYYYCPCTFTAGGPAVGNTVTGADSGETAEVIVVGATYICVTKLSAAFNADEVYTVAAVAKGTFNAAQLEKGETSALLHATALNLAADVYRADIAEPTGSGPVRGLVMLNGVLYAFVNNAGGTAGLIYKSTAAGWVNVPLLHEISFDTGINEISDGDAIIQLISGATATVSRTVLESGTWSGGDAAGRLILSTITGTFDAVEDIQVSAAITKATSTSVTAAITLYSLSFDTGVVEINQGDLITQLVSGATAIVNKIILDSGTWSGGNATGSILISDITGVFTNVDIFQVATVTKATSTSLAVAVVYSHLSFNTGVGEISTGDTITQLVSGATAVIDKVVRSSGTWVGGDAAGTLTVTNITGAFNAVNALQVGTVTKATATSVTSVVNFFKLSFDTGVGEIFAGDSVLQLVSTATAMIRMTVLELGAWADGDASGWIIVSGITGVFNAVNDLQVSLVVKATSASITSAITISPDGRYEMVVYNFTGSTDTKRIYGCDGVNRGFEFDGTVYVPIDTGMTVDTPEHVTAYKEHLIFSFGGSSQNSGIGTPYIWSAVLGAAELAIGDDVTGYAREAKGLIIYSRNSTHQLTGSSVADFVLDDVSPETGAIEWTINTVGKTYCFDDRGMIELSRVQAYGNFNLATISSRIQPRIDAMRAVAVASSVYRAKDQYRVYGSDGTGICMTVSQGRYGETYQFTQFAYPNYVSCAWSGEDSNGKDVVFFGDDAGMVYQADKGSSFDGADIESYIFSPFNNSKSPSVLKTYRKANIQMTVSAYTSLRYNPIFSYGDSTIPAHIAKDVVSQLGGGFWGLVDWSEFFWDADIVPGASIPINGDGINMSLTIYGKSQIDLGHKLDGVIVHYTPRRLVR